MHKNKIPKKINRDKLFKYILVLERVSRSSQLVNEQYNPPLVIYLQELTIYKTCSTFMLVLET